MQTLTATKERPILFSGQMVQAIQEKRKRVTRRVIKGIDQDCDGLVFTGSGWQMQWNKSNNPNGGLLEICNIKCPYGKAGDRLWVKESFYAFGHWEKAWDEDKGKHILSFVDETIESGHQYRYSENPPAMTLVARLTGVSGWHKRVSIHMPRRASRILLEITDIRCEKLQDITEQQAIAEGVERIGNLWKCYGDCKDHATGHDRRTSATASFMSLWDSINADRDFSWDSNPWVWVVKFKVLEPREAIQIQVHQAIEQSTGIKMGDGCIVVDKPFDGSPTLSIGVADSNH